MCALAIMGPRMAAGCVRLGAVKPVCAPCPAPIMPKCCASAWPATATHNPAAAVTASKFFHIERLLFRTPLRQANEWYDDTFQ